MKNVFPRLGSRCLDVARAGLLALTGASTAMAGAITPNCTRPALYTAPPAGVQETRNVTYVRHADGVVQLDLYTPTDGAARPLIVMIHGGGWATEAKGNHRIEAINLSALPSLDGTQPAYTVANINYRLTRDPNNLPSGALHQGPAQLQDVRCAVRWLKANAASFHIDPSRVALVGLSAGGHLAAYASLLSTTPQADWPTIASGEPMDSADCPVPPSAAADRINAAVAFYPPTDLTSTANDGNTLTKHLRDLLGGDPNTQGAAHQNAVSESPGTLLGMATEPGPTLIVYGAADRLVHPEKNEIPFARNLTAAGVDTTLVLIPRAQHGFSMFANNSPSLNYNPAVCTLVDFLHRTLAN